MTDAATETPGDGADNPGDNAAAVAAAITHDRPENVPEKFWNSESGEVRNDDVLKSYNELSSKFGAFTGAPDDYAFTLSEDLKTAGVELDLENPLVSQFTEMAKESNMSQEMANKLINMFVEGQHADSIGLADAETQRQTDEMKILGDNAQSRVKNIEAWGAANLPPEQAKGLEDATMTAAGVMAVEALIAKSRNSSLVNDDMTVACPVDLAELRELRFAKDDNGNRKMATDPAYRKMVEEKYAQAYPGENRIQVG